MSTYLTYVIGSGFDAQIRIVGEGVKLVHAYLYLKEEQFFIRKAYSDSCVLVNNVSLGNEKKAFLISLKDDVQIGSFRTTLSYLLEGVRQQEDFQSNEISLKQNQNRLTREQLENVIPDLSSDLDIELLFSFLDDHVQVSVFSNEVVRISGQEIKLNQKASIKDGDFIQVSHYGFCFQARIEKLVYLGSFDQLHLSARNLSYELSSGKKLIRDVSLEIPSGAFVALMGASGAGKSTLLKMFCGEYKPTDGGVFLNGVSLHHSFTTFERYIGYMPQENVLHYDLTVRENLTYALQLRKRKMSSQEEVGASIDTVLKKLNLYANNEHILETTVKNLSGGQKRMISLAVELLSEPAILMLDEPLSGLSSQDAAQVMGVMRTLADSGITVISTIHQPSYEIYCDFDQIVYMKSGGYLVYYGPPVPDSFSHFLGDQFRSTTKPDEILQYIQKTDSQTLLDRYKSSGRFDFAVMQQRSRAYLNMRFAESALPLKSMLVETRLLFKRGILQKLKDKINILTLVAQAPVVACLIALIFSATSSEIVFENAPIVCFLSVIAAAWFGASNMVRDVCGEWSLFKRERLCGLNISTYFLSKLLIASCISIVQTIIMALIVVNYCGLKVSLLNFSFTLFMVNVTSATLGLLISTASASFKKSNEIAIGLIPIILLPMFILAGFIQPIKNMSTFTDVISRMTYTRWAYLEILTIESEEHNDLHVSKNEYIEVQTRKGDLILNAVMAEDEVPNKVYAVVRVFAIQIWLSLLTYLMLIYRDPRP